MTTNIILQKKNKLDDFGYLNILYFKSKDEKKKVSLGFKMLDKHFTKTFDKEFNKFRQTILFDYKTLNNKIDILIQDTTIFDIKGSEKENSFTKYFLLQIDKKKKLTTKNNYRIAYNNLNKYLLSIDENDLLFNDLTNIFLINLKDYFINNGLQNSSIKNYFTIYKTIMNNSIDEDNYYFVKSPFRKIELKTNEKPKRILEDLDIRLLMNIPNTDTLFISSRMFLFSLFSNGMRFSDLLLLRNEDIKRNNLEYTMLKTKKKMIIPLNYSLLKILIEVYNFPDYFTEQKDKWKTSNWREGEITETYNELSKMINGKRRIMFDNPNLNEDNLIKYHNHSILKTDTEIMILIDKLNIVFNDIIDIIRIKLVKEIQKLKPKELLFNKFIKTDIYNDYNKMIPFNENQHKKYINTIIKYDKHLIRICKKYDLSLSKMSSHNSRHTFVNMLLDMENINLNDVSLTLGHKKLSTTQNYISNGFDFKKYKNITDTFNNKFHL
jgi:integrase